MKGQLALLATLIVIAGCEQQPSVDPAQAKLYQSAYEDAEITADVQKQWARSCALCHVRGEGGAPRTGDVDAWRPRLAKGKEVLMMNTVEGLNRMPPLGYCMDCELSDFAAMIEFMSAGVSE